MLNLTRIAKLTDYLLQLRLGSSLEDATQQQLQDLDITLKVWSNHPDYNGPLTPQHLAPHFPEGTPSHAEYLKIAALWAIQTKTTRQGFRTLIARRRSAQES